MTELEVKQGRTLVSVGMGGVCGDDPSAAYDFLKRNERDLRRKMLSDVSTFFDEKMLDTALGWVEAYSTLLWLKEGRDRTNHFLRTMRKDLIEGFGRPYIVRIIKSFEEKANV